MLNMVCCGGRFSDDALKRVVKSWMESAALSGWRPGQGADMEEILGAKEMGAKPGEPFDQVYPDFEALETAVGAGTFDFWIDALFRDIDEGCEPHLPAFRVHLKLDRYSRKKQLSNSWRIIQGSDALLLLASMRVFKRMVTAAEHSHPRIFLYNTYPRWLDIVVGRVGSRPTAGMDYTGYDESQPANVIYAR